MTLARTVGILLLTLSPFSASYRAQQSTEALELRNGRWFDDTRFEERTVYIVNGRFDLARPKSIDRASTSAADTRSLHSAKPTTTTSAGLGTLRRSSSATCTRACSTCRIQ